MLFFEMFVGIIACACIDQIVVIKKTFPMLPIGTGFVFF